MDRLLGSFVQVAVPVPQLGVLTYAFDGERVPPIGARVVVPLGNREVVGIVVAYASEAPDGDLRPVERVIDDTPFVPPDVIALAQWTAEYYAAGVGDAIPLLLPPMARGGRVDAHKTRRVASITLAGRSRLEELPDGRKVKRQREVLELLAAAPEGIAARELVARGTGADTLARLARTGHIVLRHERIDRDPFPSAVGPTVSPGSPGSQAAPGALGGDRVLTDQQAAAVDRLLGLAATHRFRAALLHGVTGSGKTEIYLRLAASVRSAGRRVLMLVPEIGLTPSVAGQFRDMFGERVAIQHSGLSDGERHDQWQRIRQADVDVVVGTRSAVFAPLDKLGLIIVDEEHDSSYKQEESPRYNGRDVAIVRGRAADALVVLGSATPSMESYQNAVAGRYEHLVLERRVLDRPLAAVTIVDMREEYAADGPDVILSRPLREAVATRLESREQALILLNRRGYSTAVFCRQCGQTMECPHCSVALVIHGEGSTRRARCHYCNYATRVPVQCGHCNGPYLEQRGFGTERVEAEVFALFPEARVGRLDRDVIRRKGAVGRLLSRFRDGELDVLVGTQMIAKGHDFPRVTLVGVVSADVGLGVADFRAAERTFQLLTQVAGRAGRGERPGEAIVQTLYPDHYSIQFACRQDYRAFFRHELEFRRTMLYPPHVQLVNVVVRGKSFGAALTDANEVAQRVRESAKGIAGVRVLGPAPAPLRKLRGEYRAQVLVKGPSRRVLRNALQAALARRPDIRRRTVVDVDPVGMV